MKLHGHILDIIQLSFVIFCYRSVFVLLAGFVLCWTVRVRAGLAVVWIVRSVSSSFTAHHIEPTAMLHSHTSLLSALYPCRHQETDRRLKNVSFFSTKLILWSFMYYKWHKFVLVWLWQMMYLSSVPAVSFLNHLCPNYYCVKTEWFYPSPCCLTGFSSLIDYQR